MWLYLLACLDATICKYVLKQRWGLPVWLEGDLVIARHLTEVLLQLPEKVLVALSLIQRHKGMDVGKLSPGDGLKKKKGVSRTEGNISKLRCEL